MNIIDVSRLAVMYTELLRPLAVISIPIHSSSEKKLPFFQSHLILKETCIYYLLLPEVKLACSKPSASGIVSSTAKNLHEKLEGKE